MVAGNGKPLGLWTILAIVLGTAAVLGALSGLYAERFGIPRPYATAIVIAIITILSRTLFVRRMKALGQDQRT